MRDGSERVRGLESHRVQSLLAFLLLHRDAPQGRARVAFLLWPDSTDAQARTNLRQLVHHLRAKMPSPDRYLDVTAHTIQWRPDAPCTLDVVDFERAADRGALVEAASAYGGDLLPGCYDEWVLGERDRLRQRYVDVLERLVTHTERSGDERDATRYAEALLRADPLREATYRQLMRLHARQGERARGLAHLPHLRERPRP